MVGTIFLKRYQAVTLLDKGSMGTVYLARHVEKPEVVVVKVIHPEVAREASFRQFFQSEIDSLRRLQHPCVVGLLDASIEEAAGPCLVMEFIPGVTLEKLLHRHRSLGIDQVRRLLIPLCRALTAGHALGIIHRDLKPANLMVTDPDTSRESLKVMDFGLAQLNVKPHISLDRLRGATTESAYGTPIYIAPDALRGDKVDHRSDIYSLGVVLFELLTGAPPFDFNDPVTVMNAHVRDEVPRFAHIRQGLSIPQEIENVVARCLAKFPNERFQSAKDVCEEFCKAAVAPLTAQEFPEAPAKAKQANRSDPVIRIPTGGKFTILHELDAWMPEPIAVVKLRGFVEDKQGQVLDSQPGMIRVRLFTRATAPPEQATARSMFSFLDKPRTKEIPKPPMPDDPVEILLYLAHGNDAKENSLRMTIIFKPIDGTLLKSPAKWRDTCDKLYFDLRGYLMAK